MYFKTMILSSAFVDGLEAIFNNKAFLITICTFAATVLIKTGIKIYNMGRIAKADLITRREFKEFEAMMRADMRAYKDEIQDNVIEICKAQISSELKDVKDIKKLAEDMKIKAAVFDKEVKNTEEKFKEIKPLIQSVNILEKKVRRLEYGEDTMNKEVRRTDE